jgi:Flp pilus assembly protein TadG
MQGLKRSAGTKKAAGRARLSGRRLRARLRAGSEGQSTLETAFMLPILMTLLVSLFYVSWSFNNKIMLTQAVGAGASYLQATAQNTSTQVADPCQLTTAVIVAKEPNLAPASLNLTYNLNGAIYSVNGASSGAQCSGGSSNFVLGGTVQISATYPCSMAPLSGLANLITSGSVFSSSCLIHEQQTELIY